MFIHSLLLRMVSYFFSDAVLFPRWFSMRISVLILGQWFFLQFIWVFISTAPSYYIEPFSIIFGLVWKTVDIFTGESIIIYLAFFWGWGMSMMLCEKWGFSLTPFNCSDIAFCTVLITLLQTIIHLSYQTFEDVKWIGHFSLHMSAV